MILCQIVNISNLFTAKTSGENMESRKKILRTAA